MQLTILHVRLANAVDNRLSGGNVRLAMAKERFHRAADRSLQMRREQLVRMQTRLEAVSPARVLERGYAMVTVENGVITSAAAAKTIDAMRLVFRDGSVAVRRAEEE